MKIHALWITAIALCLAACSKQEPAEPQPPESDQAAAPVEETTARFDEAFISHMSASPQARGSGHEAHERRGGSAPRRS